jgi:hypothetical protein
VIYLPENHPLVAHGHHKVGVALAQIENAATPQRELGLLHLGQ